MHRIGKWSCCNTGNGWQYQMILISPIKTLELWARLSVETQIMALTRPRQFTRNQDVGFSSHCIPGVTVNRASHLRMTVGETGSVCVRMRRGRESILCCAPWKVTESLEDTVSSDASLTHSQPTHALCVLNCLQTQARTTATLSLLVTRCYTVNVSVSVNLDTRIGSREER